MTAMDLECDDDAAPPRVHPKWLKDIAETAEITQPYRPEQGALLKLGQFEVAKELGKGGYGRVYLARDHQLHRDVAIKVIDEKFYMREQYVARIPHKNIVQFYESFSEQGARCLVLEYVPGQSLARWLFPNRVPLLEKAVSIAADVAMALVAMHEVGVAHRDLTTSNVILTRDEHVKVIDFGIAAFEATHRLEDLDGSGATRAMRTGICGTPGFAAPEQMGIGEPVSVDLRKGDLWSLGVVLFVLVTGRMPFKGIHVDTYTDTLRTCAKEGRPAPRLRDFVPEVPSVLDGLVARLLNFEPTARGMAHSASFALQEILKGLQHPGYETSLRYEGNPFRPLRAFGPGDAEIFSERAKETKALLDLVTRNRLALLQGDGGVGKSSLIQAGLRPRLWEKVVWLEVAPGWDPERSPLETVRKAAALAVEQRQYTSDEPTLDGMLASLSTYTRKPVLLVLDQFEEIFQRPDRAAMEHDAREFGDALASVVNRPGVDLRVLIVIRTDHYHYLDLLKEVFPISTDDGEVLRALESRSTKRSMVHLFERTGLDVAHTVLDDVIAAVSTRNEVNAVELQIVLHHLYEYASTLENTVVDRLSLAAMGGPKGVLDQRLEAVELRLSENSTPIVRPVMASLVGQDGARKSGLSIPEIAHELGVDEDLVRKVVEGLRKERILTVDGSSGNDALRFQVTCDRLARTVWLEEREFISQREFLQDCIRDASLATWGGSAWYWRQSVEKRERMLRGFGELASRATSAQREFVEKARKWDRGLTRYGYIGLFMVVSGVIVLIVVISLFVADKRINEQRHNAELQEKDAERWLATDPGKALALIPRAAELRGGFKSELPAEFAKQFLIATKAWHNGQAWILTTHKEEVRDAAIVLRENGGKTLVSIGGDDEVHVIDMDLGGKGEQLQISGDGKPKVLAISPNGTWAAIGDDVGIVHVLDLRKNEVATLMPICGVKKNCEVTRLAFSPDGRFLAAAGDINSSVVVWALLGDASRWDYHGMVKGHENRVRTLQFSARDGHLLLSSDVNGIAQLTSVDTLQQVWQHAANGEHSSAAFSHDGQHLAVVQGNIVETYHQDDSGKWEHRGDVVVGDTREIRMVDLHNDASSGTASVMMAIGTKEGGVFFRAWKEEKQEWTENKDTQFFSVGNSGVRMLRFVSQQNRLWVLASSIDGEIHWRDVKAATERVFHGKTAWGAVPMAFSKPNFIVGDGGNGLLKLWPLDGGHVDVDTSGEAPPQRKSDAPRDRVELSATCDRGELTLHAEVKGRIIKLGIETGSHTEDLEGHSSYIDELSFSGGCSLLTSKSRDGIVRRWPLPPVEREEFAKWLDKHGPYTVEGDTFTAKPCPPIGELFSEKP